MTFQLNCEILRQNQLKNSMTFDMAIICTQILLSDLSL